MRWQDGLAEVTSVEKLNPIPRIAPDGFQAHEDETVIDNTDDGEFLIVYVSEDCRQCGRTIVLSRQRDWKLPIENPIAGYQLDYKNDRIVSLAENTPNQKTQSIGVQIVDLKSRQKQIVAVPAFRSQPQLVAAQLLSDGRTRLAYDHRWRLRSIQSRGYA